MPKAPQTPKAHAQQIVKQIANEPFEIIKDAASQVSGDQGEWQKQTTVDLPQTGEQPATNSSLEEKAKKERIRAQGHMQAFQTELQEIQVLQQQREKERAESRAEEAEKKNRQQEQTSDQKFGPLEIIGRIKRGMMGGGKKGHVEKKQRSTELVKAPSN